MSDPENEEEDVEFMHRNNNTFDIYSKRDTNNEMDNENGNRKEIISDRDDGFTTFKSRQARGVLYKLNPMSNDMKLKMTQYIEGGYMAADLRFAREIYGLINTSGRRDFAYVWESPWIE